MLDMVYVFVTMTIPKAGAQIAGLPLTLNIILTACVILKNPNQVMLFIQRFKGFAIAYGVLLFFGLITFALALLDGTPAFKLAQIVIVLSSLLVGVSVLRMRPSALAKIVIASTVIVNAYGVIQFLGGVEDMSIQGITYTFGQSLLDKPIGISTTSQQADTKIISTFQNGNSYGIFNVLAFSFLMSRLPVTKGWQIARMVAVPLSVIGILICGSRSSVIPFALMALFMVGSFLKQMPLRTRLAAGFALAFAMIAGIAALLAQGTILQQFWERNVIHTLEDPSAAGRTDQWAYSFGQIAHMTPTELLRLFFFGRSSDMTIIGEGLPEFFFVYGIIGVCAFYGGLLLIARHCWNLPCGRTIAMGLLCVITAFCVDRTYDFPPNLMMFSLFAAGALLISEGPYAQWHPESYRGH